MNKSVVPVGTLLSTMESLGWKCNSWIDNKSQNYCISCRYPGYNMMILISALAWEVNE